MSADSRIAHTRMEWLAIPCTPHILRPLPRASAIGTIQKIAYRPPPGRIHLLLRTPLKRIDKASRFGLFLFRLATRRTTVGKPGFIGPQLKFITTNNTGLDRESHRSPSLRSPGKVWSLLQFRPSRVQVLSRSQRMQNHSRALQCAANLFVTNFFIRDR